jgi:predicted lysophospholipase L1 biosynthesis ABC-type transport system permease subunit
LRLALGARTWSIGRLAMSRSVAAVLIGAAAGVLLALALTRVRRQFAYGVDPADPATLAAAVACLAVFAMMTAAVPALRSARIPPTEALRREWHPDFTGAAIRAMSLEIRYHQVQRHRFIRAFFHLGADSWRSG